MTSGTAARDQGPGTGAAQRRGRCRTSRCTSGQIQVTVVIRGQCNAFSLGMDMLICPSLRFSWVIGAKDNTAADYRPSDI
jgi:hypothetical protein